MIFMSGALSTLPLVNEKENIYVKKPSVNMDLKPKVLQSALLRNCVEQI